MYRMSRLHTDLDKEGDKVEYRALMVIKTSTKTMAKQRKDAISNWKVCQATNILIVITQCNIVIYFVVSSCCLLVGVCKSSQL